MCKRILILTLLLLLLLVPSVHADVLFLDPSGIANTFLQEKSVPLDNSSNEFISLTDLTGWQHPHLRNAVAHHEKGRTLRIRCLYTDDRGTVWALHPHIQELGRDCWLPYDGLASACADTLPALPETLPVPHASTGMIVFLAVGMILFALLLTRAILRQLKRKTPDA